MRIGVCVKWVDTRPEVDALTGDVDDDPRRYGASPADRAAVELALQLAEGWGDATLDLVTVGPPAAEEMLRDLATTGPWRLHRVEPPDPDLGERDVEGPDSARVAAALAAVVADADLVVCGDHSLDRGSGSVPVFLAADLGAAEALGLVEIEPATATALVVTRRLGAGRSERVRVSIPAVISVEGSVADLRRAPLAALLRRPHVQLHRTVAAPAAGPPPSPLPSPLLSIVRRGPVRPRPRVVAPPAGTDALSRITELTGAFVERTPPRTVEASPEEAADLVLEQLRSWGYVE